MLFSIVDFKFEKPLPTMKYAGVRITAPSTSVFIPGFICQQIVSLCFQFNVSFLFYSFLFFSSFLFYVLHQISNFL